MWSIQMGITYIAFASGEPGTEMSDSAFSFRVLTTENHSYDDHDDGYHDDDDVAELLRCFQNVR